MNYLRRFCCQKIYWLLLPASVVTSTLLGLLGLLRFCNHTNELDPAPTPCTRPVVLP